MDRLPKQLHASVHKTLRQAGELDGEVKAEHVIRNLARRIGCSAVAVFLRWELPSGRFRSRQVPR